MQRVLAVIGERVVTRPAPCKFQIVDDKDALNINGIMYSLFVSRGALLLHSAAFLVKKKKQKHKDLPFICLAMNDNDHF